MTRRRDFLIVITEPMDDMHLPRHIILEPGVLDGIVVRVGANARFGWCAGSSRGERMWDRSFSSCSFIVGHTLFFWRWRVGLVDQG